MHWILTNREIRGPRGREFVASPARRRDRDAQAHPEFRLATFRPGPAGIHIEEVDLVDHVQFIPDRFGDDYDRIRPDGDAGRLRGSSRMFLDLYQRMRDGDCRKADVLFFIHGFNYSWHDSMAHLQKLHETYVLPDESPIGTIVYFSWPSWGSLARYPADQRNALESGFLLGRLFGKLIEFFGAFFHRDDGVASCERKIHIATHSMGAQVLAQLFAAIEGVPRYRRTLFGEVVLLSADVAWDVLEPGRPLQSLPDYAERIHVYNHCEDDALRISEWLKNATRRLGRHGPRSLASLAPRTVVVDASRLRMGNDDVRDDAFSARALSIVGGVSGVRERLIDHWGYLYRKEVIADVWRVLRGISSAEMGPQRIARSPSLYILRDA